MAAGKPITSITMGQQIDVHLKFRGLKEGAVFERRAGRSVARRLRAGRADGSRADARLLRLSKARKTASTTETYDGGWQCQICVGNLKASLQYADMREDRVVFYANANGEVSEIVYRIKATNVVRMYAATAYGEAMYDRAVVGRSASGKIEVSRP